MEITLFFLGLIFGGLISWGITHAYYKKSSKDQNAVFNKLSEEVRVAILDDNREKLSVLEINELLRDKTIDEEIGEEIPYIACPKCGSDDLERTSDAEVEYGPVGIESGTPYDIIQCKECGWTKTSHGYESPRDDV
jgi:predicted nucleic-acid-binding Zn-ribbon protein